MENRGIEDMFDFRRFPKDAFVLLLLLIYFPVGICLTLIRIFIGVHVFLVSCALPESFVRRFIVRIMCSVLGMHVRQKNPRSRDKNTKLYICNHVTEFDHNIINLLTPCHNPQFEGSTGFVCWARGFMEIHSASGQEAIEESLQRYCSTEGTPPLLLFPEEDTTNGRAGLLKFSSWPFSLTDSIQPVALRVTRPLIALGEDTDPLCGAIAAIAEVFKLTDPTLLFLEVTTLVSKYPDIREEHIQALLAVRGDASRDMRQMIIGTLSENKVSYAGVTQPIFKDISVPTITMTTMTTMTSMATAKLLK